MRTNESARVAPAQPEATFISVIIPTYNRSRFLPEVLDSVFAQRDCPAFEVVVVDDASTDDTAAVLAASPHPLQVVRLASNRGVAAARQAGVDASRGQLLAFHDSDDLMMPGRLGFLAAHLATSPHTGAVFANGIVHKPDGTVAGSIVPAPLAERLDGRSFGLPEIFREGMPVYLQSALVRRSAFEAAGGIDTSLDRREDIELICRLTLTVPVVFLNRPLFRYQLHTGNRSGDRMRVRQGIVVMMRRLRERHPEALTLLGPTWFRRREARHLYRIARSKWRAGDRRQARDAIREAVALAPHSLRYRWLSWRV